MHSIHIFTTYFFKIYFHVTFPPTSVFPKRPLLEKNPWFSGFVAAKPCEAFHPEFRNLSGHEEKTVDNGADAKRTSEYSLLHV
jgi:hypothetical protein